VKIDIILTETEHESFLTAMATEGYACIDSALANIHSEAATATRQEDLMAIRALVRSKPGAFSSLDNLVRQHLHRWFESQGAIRSAERIQAQRSSTADNGAVVSDRLQGALPASHYWPADSALTRHVYVNTRGSSDTKGMGAAVAGPEHEDSNSGGVASPRWSSAVNDEYLGIDEDVMVF
jgi:Arc/MetJ-type ribon-helix-helix transcriptional regulator